MRRVEMRNRTTGKTTVVSENAARVLAKGDWVEVGEAPEFHREQRHAAAPPARRRATRAAKTSPATRSGTSTTPEEE